MNPWPGSLMFQPNVPLVNLANSIAFSTGSSAPIARRAAELLERLVGDGRGGSEDEYGRIRMALDHVHRSLGHVAAVGEQDRIAGAGRPCCCGHREARVRRADDEQVLRILLAGDLRPLLIDLVGEVGRVGAGEGRRLQSVGNGDVADREGLGPVGVVESLRREGSQRRGRRGRHVGTAQQDRRGDRVRGEGRWPRSKPASRRRARSSPRRRHRRRPGSGRWQVPPRQRPRSGRRRRSGSCSGSRTRGSRRSRRRSADPWSRSRRTSAPGVAHPSSEPPQIRYPTPTPIPATTTSAIAAPIRRAGSDQSEGGRGEGIDGIWGTVRSLTYGRGGRAAGPINWLTDQSINGLSGDASRLEAQPPQEITMNFAFNDEQLAYKERCREFARTVIRPAAPIHDADESVPWEVMKEARRQGLSGLEQLQGNAADPGGPTRNHLRGGDALGLCRHRAGDLRLRPRRRRCRLLGHARADRPVGPRVPRHRRRAEARRLRGDRAAGRLRRQEPPHHREARR